MVGGGNKDKIKKLQQEGRLTPAAQNMILHAKNSGTWDALNDVENLVLPEDLIIEFETYRDALLNWNNFPRSTKRAILLWIYSAKRLETRQESVAFDSSIFFFSRVNTSMLLACQLQHVLREESPMVLHLPNQESQTKALQPLSSTASV